MNVKLCYIFFSLKLWPLALFLPRGPKIDDAVEVARFGEPAVPKIGGNEIG